MSWRVSVRHRTAYRYGGEVRSSYNEARVTPLTTQGQLVIEASVQVSPPAPTFRYWDYWGTLVDAFDVHEPHTELAVTGTSVVETATTEPGDTVGWDELRRPEELGDVAEFLTPTVYVPVVEELVDAAGTIAANAPNPASACDEVVEWVRGRIQYEKGTTAVSTSAAEALGIGSGVCQDFTHISLGLLRAMGIPARYVSGYTFPSSSTDVGMDVDGQSHAWVEAWIGDWYAFDPSHGVPVGERHVLVARGRDYADVPPLKGIYRGAPAEALDVTVDLTRLA
ncbi:MAG TPA: transglutaminase family protein [Acidimicrobiales bacterium]|nr:transglutaminase family protein [Acidimicrobiales bacterium]